MHKSRIDSPDGRRSGAVSVPVDAYLPCMTGPRGKMGGWLLWRGGGEGVVVVVVVMTMMMMMEVVKVI